MKILNYGMTIYEAPLNFDSINRNGVIEGEGVMLPYENKEFLDSVHFLFDEVVRESGVSWSQPDYEKSRVYFYINEENVSITFEVLPKDFPAATRQMMIDASNKEEANDGWSDDLRLIAMFDDIDTILNSSNPIGVMGVYCVELTNAENAFVLSFL